MQLRCLPYKRMFIVHVFLCSLLTCNPDQSYILSRYVFQYRSQLAVGSSLTSLACANSRSSRLVIVHGLNGNKMEKWYLLGSAVLALGLNIPPYALGQYGCVHPYISSNLIIDILQLERRKRDLLVQHAKRFPSFAMGDWNALILDPVHSMWRDCHVLHCHHPHVAN
jgi:hypothetical protein